MHQKMNIFKKWVSESRLDKKDVEFVVETFNGLQIGAKTINFQDGCPLLF